jgi:hypothetical protein
VVRDEPDPLPAHQVNRVGQQHLDPKPHASLGRQRRPERLATGH